MRRIMVLVVAVVAGVLLLGACGGDDDSPLKAAGGGGSQTTTKASSAKSSGGGSDCPLLGTDTVNEKVGHGLEMKVVLAYAEGCEWRATTDSAISASIGTEETADYERVKGLPTTKPLSGVGDEAFTTNHGVLLSVRGKHWSVEVFDLNSRTLQDAETVPIAVEIAKAFAAAG